METGHVDAVDDCTAVHYGDPRVCAGPWPQICQMGGSMMKMAQCFRQMCPLVDLRSLWVKYDCLRHSRQCPSAGNSLEGTERGCAVQRGGHQPCDLGWHG